MALQGTFNKAIGFEWNPDFYRRAPIEFDRIVRSELMELGKYLVTWMQARGPKDTEVGLSSLKPYVDKFSEGGYLMTIESQAPYAKYGLELGRGPGKNPNFDKLLGWVQRRSFNEEQIKSVRTVGSRIGASYASRKSPKTPAKRIDEATREHSNTNRQTVRQVFRIMRQIALHGTKEPKPRIFLRAISETNEVQKLAILAIERRMARAASIGAY